MVPKQSPDDYFVQLLDERFSRLHERLDSMEKRSERRDHEVNMLDTTNKAEIKAVKDQVIQLQTQMGNVKLLLKAAMWVVTAVGGFVTWAAGLWEHIGSGIGKLT